MVTFQPIKSVPRRPAPVQIYHSVGILSLAVPSWRSAAIILRLFRITSIASSLRRLSSVCGTTSPIANNFVCLFNAGARSNESRTKPRSSALTVQHICLRARSRQFVCANNGVIPTPPAINPINSPSFCWKKNLPPKPFSGSSSRVLSLYWDRCLVTRPKFRIVSSYCL